MFCNVNEVWPAARLRGAALVQQGSDSIMVGITVSGVDSMTEADL